MEVRDPKEQAKEPIKPLFCIEPRQNVAMNKPQIIYKPQTRYSQSVEELISKLAIKDGISHTAAAEKLIKEGAKALSL